MIVHTCEQGSSTWLRLRAGRPTASQFHRILTPTGKDSSQMSEYANECVAERLLGHPLDTVTMPWMARGAALEDQARSWYELQTDTTIEQVGFVTTDDGLIGCSPDGLIGADGLIEIKCPKPQTHVYYLLGDPAGAGKDYYQQVQGQMLVAERAYTVVLSYFPGLPEATVRIERDDDFCAKLKQALDDFTALVDVRCEKLVARGLVMRLDPRKPADEAEADEHAFDVTSADVDALMAGDQQPNAVTPDWVERWLEG